MNDMQWLRDTILRRITLERELAALREQVQPMERELHQLEEAAARGQADVEALNGFTVSDLFTSRAKKEEKLAEGRQQADAAQWAVDNARTQLEELLGRITSMEAELRGSDGAEERLLELCPSAEGCALLEKIRRQEALWVEIPEKSEALKALLEEAENTKTYGEPRVDAFGDHYDNRYSALKDHAVRCRGAAQELWQSLEEFNRSVPEELQVENQPPWVGDEDYWTSFQFSDDLYQRLIGVSNWRIRAALSWEKAQAQRGALARKQWQALRKVLTSAGE